MEGETAEALQHSHINITTGELQGDSHSSILHLREKGIEQETERGKVSSSFLEANVNLFISSSSFQEQLHKNM